MRAAALVFGCATLFLHSAAAAQHIRGVVVDDATSRPISGVLVELLSQDSLIQGATFSSRNGWFQLDASDGRYLVRSTRAGYLQPEYAAIEVTRKEVLTVVLRLGTNVIPLEPITVAAHSSGRVADFHRRSRGGGMGRYVMRDEIERRHATRSSDVLRVAPEVRIEYTRDGSFNIPTLFMRNFAELCRPNLYLDGMPMPHDVGFDIDDVLPVEWLEGVEIYPNYQSAPLELRGASQECGVVAFWTRPLMGKRVTWTRVGLAGLLLGMMALLTRDLIR